MKQGGGRPITGGARRKGEISVEISRCILEGRKERTEHESRCDWFKDMYGHNTSRRTSLGLEPIVVVSLMTRRWRVTRDVRLWGSS